MRSGAEVVSRGEDPGGLDTLRAVRAHAYENPRPEVQAHVPLAVSRILDLGCSSGALGAALKDRQASEVVGVEVDPAYAAAARERLDRVVEADLETLFASDEATSLGTFDCLIAADVLEHLRDPWTVLRAAVEHLAPNGPAVISLPNARYWHVLYELGVRGSWPQLDCGVCDRTHLRYFALADALALVRQAGLEPQAIAPQCRLHPDKLPWARPSPLCWRPLQPFFAFQYVIIAVRRTRSPSTFPSSRGP